jgi:hypothetical protein
MKMCVVGSCRYNAQHLQVAAIHLPSNYFDKHSKDGLHGVGVDVQGKTEELAYDYLLENQRISLTIIFFSFFVKSEDFPYGLFSSLSFRSQTRAAFSAGECQIGLRRSADNWRRFQF